MIYIFIRVTPLDGVSQVGLPPPPPPCDATAHLGTEANKSPIQSINQSHKRKASNALISDSATYQYKKVFTSH